MSDDISPAPDHAPTRTEVLDDGAVRVTLSLPGTTVVATAAAPHEQQLRSMLQLFAPQASQFRDGFLIAFGWIPARLRADGTGYVVQTAVAGTNDWTDDLTTNLVLLGHTLTVAGAAGVEPAQFWWSHDVIAAHGWREADLLMMTRDAPQGTDTGWFIDTAPSASADGDWRPDQMERLQVHQVVALHEAAARALALPAGLTALVRTQGIVQIRDSDWNVVANDPL